MGHNKSAVNINTSCVNDGRYDQSMYYKKSLARGCIITRTLHLTVVDYTQAEDQCHYATFTPLMIEAIVAHGGANLKRPSQLLRLTSSVLMLFVVADHQMKSGVSLESTVSENAVS